ncbi:MAG TPA: TylF/MycF/NovP-related O-methyltransferase [Blastocatellia bacterium]|nr:TylF/MycF/NovP-related O-methyltransferase [Blastocatellia bacterium]
MNHTAQSFFQALLQRIVLRFPKLSEGRVGVSKVMEYLRVWHYVHHAKITGDYLEFGVFRGASFDLALRTAGKFFDKHSSSAPRFFAFDSFAGLPSLHGERDGDVFYKGEYESSLATFQRNIRRAAKGWKVQVVPGFYESSLTPAKRQELGLSAAAFVNIDCDLYSSTRSALSFITPLLRTGSVIYFDDWFLSNGDMSRGEPGACSDWLAETPGLRLIDFGNVGVMGKLFIVNRSSHQVPSLTVE